MSKRSHIHRLNDARAQRTVFLVKKAVSELRRRGDSVSLHSIANESKKIDPQGRGVCSTAIGRNLKAKEIYLKHRTFVKRRPSRARVSNLDRELKKFSGVTDLAAKRRRLGKHRKDDLIELILQLQALISTLYQRLCLAGVEELKEV